MRRATSFIATDHGRVRAIGTRATMLRMRSGSLTPHCNACMPPIEAPDNSGKLPDAERVAQPALTLDHVADGKSRESQIRLRGVMAWRRVQPVSDRVGADNEVASRIKRPVGPDEKIHAVMGRADRGQDQDEV